MKCPNCQIEVAGDGDYVLLGTEIICHDCAFSGSDILQTYFCSNCQSEFSLADANVINIYSYTFNPKYSAEIEKSVILPSVENIIRAMGGFTVQVPGYLIGASGNTSVFTLVASDDDQTLAIDVLQSDESIGLTSVVHSHAKTIDASPSSILLVAIPGLNDEARAFCNSNKIKYLEGESSDILRAMPGSLMSMIGRSRENV